MAEVARERMLSHPKYARQLRMACDVADYSAFEGKDVVITGATGMVGAFLVDALMMMRSDGIDVNVVAVGRSRDKAAERLPYFCADGFGFLETDVTGDCPTPLARSGYVFNLASETNPLAYSTRPIATIEVNVLGTRTALKWAKELGSTLVLASSVEVYGQNRGDADGFSEDYCGEIDCCTLRAGYPEAKRLCESMCKAWESEHGTVVKIARLPRVFGPTMLLSDTKAVSQFVMNATRGEDVVMKSAGGQVYSYLAVADAVSGLLHLAAHGEPGKAYNVGSSTMDVELSHLATMLSSIGGSNVVHKEPDEVERAGYSTATRAVLDCERIESTGWRPCFGLRNSLDDTVEILRYCYGEEL